MIKIEKHVDLYVMEQYVRVFGGLFSYDVNDPLAVVLTIYTNSNYGNIEWVFARELLRDGLLREAGFGDVQVHPTVFVHDKRYDKFIMFTFIGLDSDGLENEMSIAIPRDTIVQFVERIYYVVPECAEIEHIDAQMTIDNILGDVS